MSAAAPLIAERTILGAAQDALQNLSDQGYGSATIASSDALGSWYSNDAVPTPDPNDPTSILWPSDNYQAVTDAWANVAAALGTDPSADPPLGQTVDEGVLAVTQANAALDAQQGTPQGVSVGTIAGWLATVAAGVGVSVLLIRWREHRASR